MSQTNQHPINGMLEASLQNLRALIDVDTIIGKTITTADGTTIIPVSKVSFGFGSGGADFPSAKVDENFGGGSGGGVTISPVAFLVIKNGNVQLLQLASKGNTAERVINMVPEVFDKVSDIITKVQEGGQKPPKAPFEDLSEVIIEEV